MELRRHTICCLAALMLTLEPSCSGRYWADRGRDLGECFVASVHAGGVGSVQARVGPVDSGLGLFLGYALGKAHWWHYGTFVWAQSGLVVIHHSQDALKLPVRYVRSSFLLLTPLQYDASDISKLNWNAPRRDDGQTVAGPFFDEAHWRVDNFFSIEVGANLLVGARIGVNLAEIADFMTGWFGVHLVPPFEVPVGDHASGVTTPENDQATLPPSRGGG